MNQVPRAMPRLRRVQGYIPCLFGFPLQLFHLSSWTPCFRHCWLQPWNPKYGRKQRDSQKNRSVNSVTNITAHLCPNDLKKLGFWFQCHHEVRYMNWITYLGWRKRRNLKKLFSLHEHRRPSVRACHTSSRNMWSHGTRVATDWRPVPRTNEEWPMVSAKSVRVTDFIDPGTW